jgi:hypothetical protein
MSYNSALENWKSLRPARRALQLAVESDFAKRYGSPLTYHFYLQVSHPYGAKCPGAIFSASSIDWLTHRLIFKPQTYTVAGHGAEDARYILGGLEYLAVFVWKGRGAIDREKDNYKHRLYSRSTPSEEYCSFSQAQVPLSRLQVHMDRLEISISWMPMLAAMMREQERRGKLRDFVRVMTGDRVASANFGASKNTEMVSEACGKCG